MGGGDELVAGGAGDVEGVDLLAASLRATSSDLSMFLDVVGDKLESALPGRVVVKRRATRFLAKQKHVVELQCQLGDRRYTLIRTPGGVEARRATAVRGIVLKSEPLRLDEWIDSLARDLGVEAGASEQSRAALDELLSG